MKRSKYWTKIRCQQPAAPFLDVFTPPYSYVSLDLRGWKDPWPRCYLSEVGARRLVRVLQSWLRQRQRAKDGGGA